MLGPTNSRRSVHASSCVHRLGQSILFDNKAGASGMLGAEFVTYAKANPGVLAPTGTPLSVVAKLDQAIAASLRAADIMEKVHNGGMRVTYLGPADFKARIAAKNKSFGEIIKKGNIKLT